MSREQPARVGPLRSEDPLSAVPAPRAKARPRTNVVTRLLPPHAVILHSDPTNGFIFVVDTLMKVFRYGGGKALWLTIKAHTAGRTVVWVGPLEVAELKAEQVRACGPDPEKVRDGATPLRVTTEALAG